MVPVRQVLVTPGVVSMLGPLVVLDVSSFAVSCHTATLTITSASTNATLWTYCTTAPPSTTTVTPRPTFQSPLLPVDQLPLLATLTSPAGVDAPVTTASHTDSYYYYWYQYAFDPLPIQATLRLTVPHVPTVPPCTPPPSSTTTTTPLVAQVFRPNGVTVYAGAPLDTVSYFPSLWTALIAADLDRDGDVDLVVSHAGSNPSYLTSVAWLENTGGAGATAFADAAGATIPPHVIIHAVPTSYDSLAPVCVVADLNNDASPDLVCSMYSTETTLLSWLPSVGGGRGEGLFSGRALPLNGTADLYPASIVAAADLGTCEHRRE